MAYEMPISEPMANYWQHHFNRAVRKGQKHGYIITHICGIMTLTSLSGLPILLVFLIMQPEFISGALAGSVKG
jgi:ABC-type glycerol-3-phosphate transport system permease component